MRKFYFFFLLLISGFSQTVSAQFPTDVANRLQFVIDSITDKYNVKGVSAAVLVPGRGVWTGTSGVSHAGVPLNTNMVFCMGSNTKTYIAALLLKLQEQGKIDLDDTVGKYIKGFPNLTGSATLRQCLNHTSGITDYFQNSAVNDSIFGNPSKIWTYQDLFALAPAPSFQPGTNWGYSNTNYIILGEVLQQVMAQSPFKSLEEYILAPSGLTMTYNFGEQPQSVVYAHPWTMNITGNSLTDLTTTPYLDQLFSMANTAGGLITTPEQNVQFWHKLFEGYLINKTSLEEMTTMRKVGGGVEYGLGIMRRRNANNRVVYEHGGTFFGFLAENMIDTTSKVCITVFTNQDSLNNGGLQVLYVAKLHKEVLSNPVLSAPELEVEKRIVSVYPNPAKDIVRIEVDHFDGPLTFELRDLSGKLVQQGAISEAQNAISIHNLAEGVYMVQLQGKDGATYATQKLIVAR